VLGIKEDVNLEKREVIAAPDEAVRALSDIFPNEAASGRLRPLL
jgi:hypothetical protein